MGVQLRSGRGLTPNDTAGAPPVVVVNEAFARRFLPNEDPLGRNVRFSPPGFTPPTASAIEWEIVGVVESVGVGPPDRLSPEVYVHYEQHPTRRGYVSLRAAGDPLQLVEPARATIRAMDAQVLFGEPRTLEQIRSQSFAIPRILTSLVAGFGGLALLLSGMGLYGLMAWLVTQRTQELGVRSALGASRRDLLVLVLRQACARTWVGIAVGSWAPSRRHGCCGRCSSARPRATRTRSWCRRRPGLGGARRDVGAGAARLADRPRRRAARGVSGSASRPRRHGFGQRERQGMAGR
jgi:putative ABC transport system permease protein